MNKEELFTKWYDLHFESQNSVLPSDLGEFSQIALSSYYNADNRDLDYELDTIDLGIHAPFKSNKQEVIQYLVDLDQEISDEIIAKGDKLQGIVIAPRFINSQMITRVLLLSSNSQLADISQRSVNCNYEFSYAFTADYGVSNCDGGGDRAEEELERKFNAACYWPHPNLLGCQWGTVRTFKLVPSKVDEEYELEGPCSNFTDCYNITQNSFNPNVCANNSNSLDFYCDLLLTSIPHPKYKLFRRSGSPSNCIEAVHMNQYQQYLGQLVQEIRNDNYHFPDIDQSWRVKRVFMNAEGNIFDLKEKYHEAIFLFETCAAKFPNFPM